jgi:hypothetical protein
MKVYKLIGENLWPSKYEVRVKQQVFKNTRNNKGKDKGYPITDHEDLEV